MEEYFSTYEHTENHDHVPDIKWMIQVLYLYARKKFTVLITPFC